MIRCNIPTENFSSGRALLKHADHGGDGRIGAVDIVRASQQVGRGEMTMDEIDFVVKASVEGEIDDFCPPPPPTATSYLTVLAVGAVIIYILTR